MSEIERKRGAGTGLSVGGLSAGAQLGTEPGADPEYARAFKNEAVKTPEGLTASNEDSDPLRRGVKLDEEYTP